MKNAVILKLAASALVVGTVAIGCTPASNHPSLSSAAPKAEGVAAKAAAEAASAIKNRKADKAIAAAEKAVTLAPRNADYRALLGQAYLQGGRFTSAETSFEDALSLDSGNGKAALSLALAQISLGKRDAARATLAEARGKVPEADIGLGLALAGDAEGSLGLLTAAARTPGADAKVRQNLALAFALAGRWREARIVAAQDLPANEVAPRLQKWAAFAQPRSSYDQVAALLGVTPVQDPGQPVQLALSGAPAEVQTALVAPVAQPQPAAPAALVEVAAADVSPSDTPLIAAEQQPIRTVPEAAASDGRYVVQLGAYSSARRAEIAWDRKIGSLRALANHIPATATVRRPSGTMYRLAALGFQSRFAAVQLCREVKASGGDCFVRVRAGDAPVQWASRRGTAYASR